MGSKAHCLTPKQTKNPLKIQREQTSLQMTSIKSEETKIYSTVKHAKNKCLCVYVCVYVYIYIEREREGEWEIWQSWSTVLVAGQAVTTQHA